MVSGWSTRHRISHRSRTTNCKRKTATATATIIMWARVSAFSHIHWQNQTKLESIKSLLLQDSAVQLSIMSSGQRGNKRNCQSATTAKMNPNGNPNVVLEDMAICMSKCASNVANGTGVMSGVSWVPDGVSCDLFAPQEVELMVTLFSKLLFYNSVVCWSSSLCFNPTFTKWSWHRVKC